MDASFRRFSLFYFCYYAVLGAYTPYISRWVNSLGHGGYVVGAMLGLLYGTRIIAPPLWTALIHRSKVPGQWFVAGAVLALLSFAGFTLSRSAWALLAVMSAFGFFYNGVMPQFEAMTLAALGADSHQYGRIRVWGSIGFLIVASSYGALLDRIGDAAFPWLTLPLLLATVLAAWPHRHDPVPVEETDSEPAVHLWKRPGVRRFLLVALLMQTGFGPFYVFYTLHLQAHGHDGFAVGSLWGLGVLIEIALFWQSPKLIARFGAKPLMLFCLIVTSLRWAVTAWFADSLILMAAAQLLHAFSFAVFHACCMRRMVEFFPGKLSRHGQSLLYGFSSGIGGVLGALMAAWMWERGGGEWAFMSGAIVVALAAAIHSRAKP